MPTLISRLLLLSTFTGMATVSYANATSAYSEQASALSETRTITLANSSTTVPAALQNTFKADFYRANVTAGLVTDKVYIQLQLERAADAQPKNQTVDAQCVVDNIKKDTLQSLVNAWSDDLINKHPDQIATWSRELPFLARVNQAIIDYPEGVSFDKKDLANSSAMQVVNQEEQARLLELFTSPEYAPLLDYLGFPNTINASKPVSAFFIHSQVANQFIADSAVNHCGFEIEEPIEEQ